jgi:acetyl esterase
MTPGAPPDVLALRESAARRARSRPALPFAGTVDDVTLGPPHRPFAGRWYRPAATADAGRVVVFLHGGYGILGDLDLQDGYCRRIARALTVPVLAVAYRLAPEHTLADAVDDALAAVAAARAEGGTHADVVLWGDSAGGAVALAAAPKAAAAALVLTNPNVDLTLAHVDAAAPGGPDRELSAWAFARWAGAGRLSDAPDLAADVARLPPLFAAVGSADSLVPDSLRLVRRRGEAHLPAQLLVIGGAAHGFMAGEDERATEAVLTAAGAFLDRVPSSR